MKNHQIQKMVSAPQRYVLSTFSTKVAVSYVLVLLYYKLNIFFNK